MKKTLYSCLWLALSLFSLCTATAQTAQLQEEIAAIAKDAKGTVGVAIQHLESGVAVDYNGSKDFPMQSTFKFPISMAVLHLVDEGKLKLDQKVRVSKAEMVKDTWSPLRDENPNGADITLDRMLSAMISQSDNIACDALLKLIGGVKIADQYIKSIGVKNLDIVGTEGDMHRDLQVQYRNRSTPLAMLQLLALLYNKSPLSAASSQYLMKKMYETTTGPKRLKGRLPEGTAVAHKTGTGNTLKNGITTATNDVGVIDLPNGQHLAIVVFVRDAAADEATREDVIARIAEAAWKRANNK